MSASNFQGTEHIYSYTSEKADYKGCGSCTTSGSPMASPNKQLTNLNHPPLTPKATTKKNPPQNPKLNQPKQKNPHGSNQILFIKMLLGYSMSLFVQTCIVQWGKASLHVARNSSMWCDSTKSAAAPRRIRFNSLPSAVFVQRKEQRQH